MRRATRDDAAACAALYHGVTAERRVAWIARAHTRRLRVVVSRRRRPDERRASSLDQARRRDRARVRRRRRRRRRVRRGRRRDGRGGRVHDGAGARGSQCRALDRARARAARRRRAIVGEVGDRTTISSVRSLEITIFGLYDRTAHVPDILPTQLDDFLQHYKCDIGQNFTSLGRKSISSD